ncbi:hypothetical protein LCGC14_2682430 [marine sediment metagenome]|uniref:Uncharacterized protein n=1 Tax=marine sediment metagenome TaxID=412755 RepID=A0A0F8ZL08_9ZZZZ
MREITFRTVKYHVAQTPKELKEATQASYQPGFTPHHIFGRVGIMSMTVENILYVSPWVHGMQKSTSMDDRKTFEMYVKNAIGEERWEKLKELAERLKENLDGEAVMIEALSKLDDGALEQIHNVVFNIKRKTKVKTRKHYCVDMKVGRYIIPIVD